MRDASPVRPFYLSFLPEFLFRLDPLRARYIVKVWPVALLPSVLISILVQIAAPGAERPEFPMTGPILPIMILLLVVIGPLIETLLMAGPLLLLERLAGPGPAVVGSAILWAILHSLQVPTWGLVVWWGFLVMSIAFLTWRAKGLGQAILVTWTIHGLQNSVVAVTLVLSHLGR